MHAMLKELLGCMTSECLLTEHGMPRSGVVGPSVPHEELEQISSCHTFSSVMFSTVASKEAVSVTSGFRGK